MDVYTHEKTVFFLPVNILTVWSLAFLAARHTTVCLDTYSMYIHIYVHVCQSVCVWCIHACMYVSLR